DGCVSVLIGSGSASRNALATGGAERAPSWVRSIEVAGVGGGRRARTATSSSLWGGGVPRGTFNAVTPRLGAAPGLVKAHRRVRFRPLAGPGGPVRGWTA